MKNQKSHNRVSKGDSEIEMFIRHDCMQVSMYDTMIHCSITMGMKGCLLILSNHHTI